MVVMYTLFEIVLIGHPEKRYNVANSMHLRYTELYQLQSSTGYETKLSSILTVTCTIISYKCTRTRESVDKVFVSQPDE